MFIPDNVEEQADKFKSPWVNHEGYSDPTAKKALDTACRFHEGEVWEVQTHTGNTELVLILKAYESKIIVVPIYEPKKYNITDENRAYTRYIKYDDKYGYYFDIRCIRPKPAKYFVEMQFPLLASEYTKIVADVARLFYDEDVTRRIDILERQADKYRIMINSLKAEKAEAEETVKTLRESVADLDSKRLVAENKAYCIGVERDDAVRIINTKEENKTNEPNQALCDNVQILLMAQKIDIYEKLLGITWRAGNER